MPTKQLERVEQRIRPIAGSDFALRAAETDDMPVFTGHAAVFNSRTAIGNPLTWGFYEQVSAGAFTKTLQEGDARFLIDHDTSLLVARVSAGDLRLVEDNIGLAVEADLDTELSYVRDFVRNLEKRRITGMSFGFRVVKDRWEMETVSTSDGQEAEVEVRTILEVELFECSGVTFPAYEETDAALRALSRSDYPDPLGRRSDILDRATVTVNINGAGADPAEVARAVADKIATPEPGETTRDDESQPAATTGTRASVLAKRAAEKQRERDERLAALL